MSAWAPTLPQSSGFEKRLDLLGSHVRQGSAVQGGLGVVRRVGRLGQVEIEQAAAPVVIVKSTLAGLTSR